MLHFADNMSEVENSAANNTLNVNITIISNSIIKHSINDTLSNVNKNNNVNINNIVKSSYNYYYSYNYNINLQCRDTARAAVKIISRPVFGEARRKTTNRETNG